MDLTMPMRCPKGHLSTDADYCSECGAKMPAAPSGLDAASSARSGASARSSASAALAAGQSGSMQTCPDCGTPRATPTATFCEVCRYNFVTGVSWAAPKVGGQPLPPLSVPASPQTPQTPGADLPQASNSSAQSAASAAQEARAPAPQGVSTPAPAAAVEDAAFPPSASGSPDAAFGAFPPDALTGMAAQTAPNAAVSAISADVSPNGFRMSPGPTTPPSADTIAPSWAKDSAKDSSSGMTQAPVLRWEAVVVVDPALYTDPDPEMPCPIGEPERMYPLDFADNLIGRRSDKRDIHPEINLNDGCVSHRHAKLQRQPDGGFALLDVGSTNGTRLNGVEVQPGVRTPLQDGDEITLGCWTRITIRGVRS